MKLSRELSSTWLRNVETFPHFYTKWKNERNRS